MKRSPAGAACACLPFLVAALGTLSTAPSTAQMLPDSAVLARIGDRTITVYGFRNSYFLSEGQTRPATDSTGRVTFLNTMIDKDVMALTALGLGQQLRLEDRLAIKGFESNELARVYFSRRVLDSVVVTEKEIKRAYPQYLSELKLRYLLLDRQDKAEKIRADLVRGRISWREAARLHSLAPDSMAWVQRSRIGGRTGVKLFELQPTGISDVMPAEDGFRIWQCVDRRPADGPPYSAVRRSLLEDLKAVATGPRAERFYATMRARAGARFDTANIDWLAEKFRDANRHLLGPSTPMTYDLRSTRIPSITEVDTGRVLATTRHGVWTVLRVLEEYRAAPSLTRTRIVGYSALFGVVQRMALQPDIAELAREEGYDRDPPFVAQMALVRESILVERMYADSVETQLRITEAKRKAYYEAHRREFVTRERVRYASIFRKTEAGADSVIARIAAGIPAYEIVHDDSLQGLTSGAVRELFEGQPYDYRAILFDELKQGGSTKVAVGGSWVVFHVLEHAAERPMAYPEVVTIVDETVQNIEAERLLQAMLKRLRNRYPIQAHPELVMRVTLVDPIMDWKVPSGD